MQQIADRIEALRTERGISETELSLSSGIARMTLRRRLADPAAFSVRELEQIAGVLGTTAEHLILGTEVAA